MIELIQRANQFLETTAIISDGQSHTYAQLLQASESMASHLLQGRDDLDGERIGFSLAPGFDYVVTQWAIWRAGGIALPLHHKNQPNAHTYALKDAGVKRLIVAKQYLSDYQELASDIGIELVTLETEIKSPKIIPIVDSSRGAMILYTSGTTGDPKGVLTTHANIQAQISSLITAWHWTSTDHIINVLPMHHVHGIVNVLCCALWSGATCEFLPFDENNVMSRLIAPEVTLFMAVHTIYFKLINYWESINTSEQQIISQGLKNKRLMVSGSAALPVTVLEKWRQISSHTLLERYGMTEIGMAISNPYEGERLPGHIGQPLPNVSIRIVDEEFKDVSGEESGEILVKGPAVFKAYWNKPEETAKAFTDDGWFKTGDVAINTAGSIKIIGRRSIDIIKSGGYKLSALEIEEVIRQFPAVKDCGVVGLPSEEWGEIVAVGLVLSTPNMDLVELKSWLGQKLASYKVPRIYSVIDDLPKNAMGKVVKMELKKILRQ